MEHHKAELVLPSGRLDIVGLLDVRNQLRVAEASLQVALKLHTSLLGHLIPTPQNRLLSSNSGFMEPTVVQQRSRGLRGVRRIRGLQGGAPHAGVGRRQARG